MTATALFDSVRSSSRFREILDQLEEEWNLEQKKRHEFWDIHDEGVKAEFINGEIVYHSPVYGRHWMASSNLLRFLLPYIHDRRLGKIGTEKVLCRFTRNDYEPDIVFWPKEVATTFTPKQSVFPPPAFIVEILSDSTEQRDRGIKFEDYSYHGVQEYWIVDTEQASVEQYLHNGKELVLAVKLREGVLHSEVIAGFRLQVQDIFIDPLT